MRETLFRLEAHQKEMKSIIKDSIRDRKPTTIEKSLMEEDEMSDSVDSKLAQTVKINMQARLFALS